MLRVNSGSSLVTFAFCLTCTFGAPAGAFAASPPCTPETLAPCTGGDGLDDGTAESWRGWTDTVTAGTRVQRFTPPFYPFSYTEMCTAWAQNAGDSSISWEVVVFDDDGTDGAPGTLLTTSPATTSGVPALYNYLFDTVGFSGPVITDGSVYIGARYDASAELGFFQPQDESPGTPAQQAYISNDGGTTWFPAELGYPEFRAFLIRARSAEPFAVVPTAQRSSDGNAAEDVPFHLPTTRYQQVYLGSEVGAGVISEIRFRLDRGELGQPFGPTVFAGATVTLSTTTVPVDALSTTFSANTGADARVVFQGDLTLSAATASGDLRPFEIVIELQHPFQFTGSGNLLLDIRLPNGYTPLTELDAVNAVDSVSRAFCGDLPACLSGDTAMITDSVGLVTLFGFADLALFTDGFESGDTGAWSSAVP